MEKPLISIIVPAYNVQDYITDCLTSLTLQTYANLEIIVIDDGSTDQTGNICDALASNDQRIRVIHQQNAGLSSARNKGIIESKGGLIAFVDGDDTVKPEYVEKLVENLSEHDDISVCGYLEKDNNVEKIVQLPTVERLSGIEATKRLLINQENYDLVAWNKLYRKKLFIEHQIKYPVGEIHEDSLTTYKLYAAARQVSFCQEPLYAYRHRSGSIMSEIAKIKSLEFRERAANEAIEYFKNNTELKPAAEIALLTAKFAYLDCAIRGEIDQKHGDEAESWIKEHKKAYRHNPSLTKKLRLYLKLGSLYRAFRGITN